VRLERRGSEAEEIEAMKTRLAHPGSVSTLHPTPDEWAVDTPFAAGVHDELDPDLRHRMISEVVWHLYEQRGFDDGHDVEDWLQAEAVVDHLVPGRADRRRLRAD
jgi:hypothetical protein